MDVLTPLTTHTVRTGTGGFRLADDFVAVLKTGSATDAVAAIRAMPREALEARRHHRTALHLASMRNDAAGVDLLIEKGADLGAKTRYDLTPLHLAIRAGSVLSVQALLARGADIEAPDHTGCRPLHDAVTTKAGTSANHLAVLDAVITGGAKLNEKNNVGLTPLHIATSATVVRRLLAAGADLELKDSRGWTPLHYSFHYTNAVSRVRALLDAGADMGATNQDGETFAEVVTKNLEAARKAHVLARISEYEAMDRAITERRRVVVAGRQDALKQNSTTEPRRKRGPAL